MITRSQLIEALEKHGGNKAAAARELGVSRNTIYKLIKMSNLRRNPNLDEIIEEAHHLIKAGLVDSRKLRAIRVDINRILKPEDEARRRRRKREALRRKWKKRRSRRGRGI
jgi:hypothetical protein